MELNFSVQNQKIKYNSNHYIVAGSRNYLTAKFSFSGKEWKDVVKTAIFKKGDAVYNILLDADGRCTVPYEVITSGILKVSVFGGDLVTVDTADVKILKSGYEEGNAPGAPPTDVYAQILAELQSIRTDFVTEEMLGQAVEDWLADNVVEALSPDDVKQIVYDYMETHKEEIRGEKGEDGVDGATFTPNVTDGVLSWSNDKGLENPSPYDFKEDFALKTDTDDLAKDVTTLKDNVSDLQSAKDITTTADKFMPNSHKGRLLIEEIDGVCEQGENPTPDNPQEIRTVKGKNLLDCRGLMEKASNGVTFTPVYDGNGHLLYAEANGTATATAVYTLAESFDVGSRDLILSGSNSASSMIRFTYDSAYVNNINAEVSLPQNTIGKISARIVANTVCENLRFYPMIRPASVSDSTYVPYGLLRVKTRNKNHIKPYGVDKSINGITATHNNGKVSLVGTATLNFGYDLCDSISLPVGEYYTNVIVYRRNESASWLETIQPDTVFSVTDETQLFRPLYYFNKGETYNIVDAIPMICLAEYKNVIEPYTESSITLSEPIELCGIGDVQDVIDVQNGAVRKRIKKVVFDGANYESAVHTINGYPRFAIENILEGKEVTTAASSFNNLLNSHFKVIGNPIGDNAVNNACCGYSPNVNMYIRADQFATVDEFKAFFAEKPMTVIYELATEEVTALPTADQIALNSLATYDGTTYLEWDCYLEPTHKGKYGTSEVGGYALEGLLTGRNAEIQAKADADRITALETALISNV